MPDVSKATMYRQISLLLEGGILEVDSEQKVGGTVERRYRLHESRAVIRAEAVASASLEDYRLAFTTSLTAMLGEFNAYLDRGHADPGADGVGFRQHSIWLTENERNELMNMMRKAIMPFLKNEPEPERRQYILSPILFPSNELFLKMSK